MTRSIFFSCALGALSLGLAVPAGAQTVSCLNADDTLYVKFEDKGGYLSARRDYDEMRGDASAPRSWEGFRVSDKSPVPGPGATAVDHLRASRILPGDTVSLKGTHGKYVMAKPPGSSGNGDVQQSPNDLAWERWTIEAAGPASAPACLTDGDRIRLKSSHGTYLYRGNDGRVRTNARDFGGASTLVVANMPRRSDRRECQATPVVARLAAPTPDLDADPLRAEAILRGLEAQRPQIVADWINQATASYGQRWGNIDNSFPLNSMECRQDRDLHQPGYTASCTIVAHPCVRD